MNTLFDARRAAFAERAGFSPAFDFHERNLLASLAVPRGTPMHTSNFRAAAAALVVFACAAAPAVAGTPAGRCGKLPQALPAPVRERDSLRWKAAHDERPEGCAARCGAGKENGHRRGAHFWPVLAPRPGLELGTYGLTEQHTVQSHERLSEAEVQGGPATEPIPNLNGRKWRAAGKGRCESTCCGRPTELGLNPGGFGRCP